MTTDKSISRHVTWNHLCVSSKYPELVNYNELTPSQIMTAKLTAMTCVDPIIDEMGYHVIQSFIRGIELNKRVKGHPFSSHILGSAIDKTPMDKPMKTVIFWIYHNLKIDWRKILIYPKENFYHIEINTPYKSRLRNAYIKNYEKEGWIPYLGDKECSNF